ncbi:MAG TPA: hypothetical protein VKB58_08155 [Terriglobales bacterium]|nr:hypothetical protein [Terriglobales bacterium]
MGYYEKKKEELQELLELIRRQKGALEVSINYLKRTDEAQGFVSFEEQMQRDREALIHIAKERQIGFPWLAKAQDDYFQLQEDGILKFLVHKSRPAIKAADIVHEYSKRRRDAERRARVAEYLLAYYEHVAPFLVDLKEEVDDPTLEDRIVIEDYSEEELEDTVTGFLTKQEYRRLSVTERNQLALDRFWQRPKSKWLIGRLYERYIGYLYECEGYDVEYRGIFEGLADLGRDLLCKRPGELIIIQCKNWSKFRVIYEKHIFQFFGTVFQYRDENPGVKVRAGPSFTRQPSFRS